MAVRRENFGTQGALTITLAALAAGAGRISAQIDNNDAALNTAGKNVDLVICHARLRMGGTAPAAGKTLELYLVRGDGNAMAHTDANLGASDAAVSDGSLRDQLELLASIPVTATASKDYFTSFLIRDPGPKWSVLVWNGADQALDGTAGNFYIRYHPVTDNIA